MSVTATADKGGEEEADPAIGGNGYSVEPPSPESHIFLFKETEHPEGGMPRTIAFKDVTVVPRGYEELVDTKPDQAVTIKLEMRNGTIVDTDIDDIDRSGRINLDATLETHFTANSIGLVIGGWLPSMLAAVGENSAILLDRNAVTEIVSRFDHGQTKGRPADFIDMLAGMDVSINPGLYAMEGSLRRIPDLAHVREELEWATTRISRALPKAKMMIGAQSIRGISGVIEDSRASLERELQFLLKAAPILKSPIGHRRQDRVWDEVARTAAECEVAPKALALLAALSTVVTPQSAPARGLLKFRQGYSEELAYNALCDLRAINYLLHCTARFPELHIQLCTGDRDLALFWTALGASPRMDGDSVMIDMVPHRDLMPPEFLDRWNRQA